MKRRIITRSNVEQSSQTHFTGGRRLLCMIAAVVMVVPLFVMASPAAEANNVSPVGGGVFYIRSYHSDVRRLDRRTMESAITYRRSANTTYQRWVVQRTGTVGQYRIWTENGNILAANASGSNLNIVGATPSITDGRDLWRFVRYRANEYQIVNVGRGMRLTASRFSSGYSDIEPVRLEYTRNALGQRHIWRFERPPVPPRRTTTGAPPTGQITTGTAGKATWTQYFAMGLQFPFSSINQTTTRIATPFRASDNHFGTDLYFGTRGTQRVYALGNAVVTHIHSGGSSGHGVTYRLTDPRFRCPVSGNQLIVNKQHFHAAPQFRYPNGTTRPLRAGDNITRTNFIAHVGNTGGVNSNGHLHLEIGNNFLRNTDNPFTVGNNRNFHNRINPLYFWASQRYPHRIWRHNNTSFTPWDNNRIRYRYWDRHERYRR